MEQLPEFWLRGPVPDIPPLLMPVAHALLQAIDDVESVLISFPDQLLWQRPGGVASVGFHLQHLRGVLDRMCTYANGNPLSDEQLNALAAEGNPSEVSVKDLIEQFKQQVDLTINQLKQTPVSTLTDYRSVGRAKLPSTVIGLLFHAAEHTQRHVGQLLVTARIYH
jgi:hypothetical protein